MTSAGPTDPVGVLMAWPTKGAVRRFGWGLAAAIVSRRAGGGVPGGAETNFPNHPCPEGLGQKSSFPPVAPRGETNWAGAELGRRHRPPRAPSVGQAVS